MAAISPCRTRCAAFQKPTKSPPNREPSDSSWKYLIRLAPACAVRHIAHNISSIFCNGRMGPASAWIEARTDRNRLEIDLDFAATGETDRPVVRRIAAAPADRRHRNRQAVCVTKSGTI